MKVVSKSPLIADKYKWNVSIVCLGKDASAQIVICDMSNTFQSMVCVMNTQQDDKKMVSSVLMDQQPDLQSEAMREMNRMAGEGDEAEDINDGATSELAKMLGEKICRKTGLPQLFISLNVAQE